MSEKWLKRVGGYEIVNVGDDILFFDDVRLARQDDFLVVEYASQFITEGTVKFPIAPISDTEAIILGLGSGMGETIHVISIDGKEYLMYSGYQLRKVSTN